MDNIMLLCDCIIPYERKLMAQLTSLDFKLLTLVNIGEKIRSL